jgi:hypothetical protein
MVSHKIETEVRPGEEQTPVLAAAAGVEIGVGACIRLLSFLRHALSMVL